MTIVDTPPELLGRDGEWASLLVMLGQVAGGPAAAVIEGDAGIGKTALWTSAVAAAEGEAFGLRVLRARPTGGDSGISYAVLLELFDHLPDSALAGLPGPQRDALDVALRRRRSDEGVDGGTIAVASLAVVRAVVAAGGPILIAVDDLHEADPAGLRVLEFIVRRLSDEPVGFLLARRPSTDPASPLRLADALMSDRLRTIRPEGLSVGALNHVLTSRLGVAFSRPLVVRIHAATDGNPQFALEIARELDARGVVSLPASVPLPVPGTIQEVVGRRLARLDPATREIVAFAAEMERPTRARLRLVGEHDADRAVDAALAADVLALDGATLRFTHPIVRTAAALAVPDGKRREVHARLAELADDPEERAHHLGRSVAEPSEAVAAALDAGADAAARRGAPEAALRLRERALELSVADAPHALNRRRLDLADAVSDSGDFARARALLQAVLDTEGSEPDHRYEAVILLGTLMWYDNEADAGRRLLRGALEDAADNRLWAARLHSRLTWLTDDDVAQAAVHADAALALMRPEEDPAAYAFALLNRALQTLFTGGPPDDDSVRRGADLQASVGAAEISSVPGVWPKYADRFAESRAWLAGDLARLRSMGDEGSTGQSLGYLAELEAWTGNLAQARRYAEEGLELIRHIGQQGMIAVAIARLVLVDSIEGDDAAAVAGLAEMRRLEAQGPDPWTSAMCDQTEVFLAISAGDLATADRAARHATEVLEGIGLVEPAMFRFHADQIEAVIGLGELDRAERLLARLEDRHRVFPRPWIAATSARCRALLAAAHGHHDSAIHHLDRALAAHADLDWPLEHVRTLIAGAQVLRRANRRKRAHELATEAAELADRLGAPGWAARARAEAARLGIEHGEGDRLTPSERRIAELAATGATNREIGDRLLVSPKTVEATLARSYAKLGIRSRAQLHARLQQGDPDT